MPTTTLLLVRHGETDDNHNNVFQGQSGRGLNARGREQAARLADRLACVAGSIHAIYCSDLERARETADIVAAPLGLTPIADPGLREVNLGTWEGLSGDDVRARFPDEWEAWKAGRDLKRGGGESYAELGVRVGAAVDRATVAHVGRTIVLVSHGATIKTFVASVLGIGIDRLHSFAGTPNTSVNLVERDAAGVDRLLVWNDATHLRDPVLEALGRRA